MVLILLAVAGGVFATGVLRHKAVVAAGLTLGALALLTGLVAEAQG